MARRKKQPKPVVRPARDPYADLWDAYTDEVHRPTAYDPVRGAYVTPKVRPSGRPRSETEGSQEGSQE
jgi:hypothetical protein